VHGPCRVGLTLLEHPFYNGRMTRAAYVDATVKSALQRVNGMPFEWSLNPYGGCEHSCQYCYARDYYARAGKDPARGFDRRIEARTNIVDLLRSELRLGRDGVIAIGTATDPYQPAEGRYQLTRRCLEVMLGEPIPPPITVITKGTLIVRDAELLAALGRRTDVRVFFSIGTIDETAARALEPDAPPPRSRLRALSALRAAGVKACVICAPIVPGFGDSEGAIDAVARAALQSGAYAFHHRILKLDPSVRPLMLAFLREQFPALAERYEVRYAGTKLDPEYAKVIDHRVDRVHARYRFPIDDAPARPRPAVGQLHFAM
jgi:DNA repair photolyase